MNLRDWLIVVGVVIIVCILLDGYRRMRLAKKDSLKMSIDMGGTIDESPLDDGFNPELPSGGARIIRAGADEHQMQQADKQEPHISSPDLNSVTDVHMADADSVSEENLIVANSDSRIDVDKPEPKIKNEHAEKPSKKTAKAGNLSQTSTAVDDQNEQLVLVLNVHSQEGSFPGVEIKKLLEACGLDHGEMSIFHRHEEDDLLSPIQFSVANAVEPGYFDPDTLHEIATPGVSFFMSLPGPKNYMKAFDYMLETAQCFARNLKGDLKDQDRSMMTAQTIEHCRQQIKEFERKQLSKSRV